MAEAKHTPGPCITFEPARFEVPTQRNGRPGYKWVDGLYVVVNGAKQYPPMRIREAKAFARAAIAKAEGRS